jgi:hypothetical protein
MTAWLVPTVRATPWQPLGVAAVLVAGVSLTEAYAGQGQPGLLGTTAGTLAAAVVAGLHDPAASLLAAVPTSIAVRRARRLVLLAPAALVVWLALGPGGQVAHVVALAASGVAVAVWWGTPAGVVVPLAWAAASRIEEDLGIWSEHPWAVTVTAGVVAWTGRNR